MATDRVIAWSDAAQQTLVREAIDEAGLTLAAIGSPREADAATLAEAFDQTRFDDLRAALAQDEDALLLLTSASPPGEDERRLIRERSGPAVSLLPAPVSVNALVTEPAEARTVRVVPLARRSPGFLAAREALDTVGVVRGMAISMSSAPSHGGLLGRLFDALDLVNRLMGVPEQIDAALCGPVPGVPEHLGGLHGHLTVNLRFPESRCASIGVSDDAGQWHRTITVWGDAASVRIEDHGFDASTLDGTSTDHHREAPLPPGTLIGRHIRRVLDQLDPADRVPDVASLLAVAEATRLSCRTGQAESPRRILDMLRGP